MILVCVEQDVYLFAGTVLDRYTGMEDPDASDEEVIRAA